MLASQEPRPALSLLTRRGLDRWERDTARARGARAVVGVAQWFGGRGGVTIHGTVQVGQDPAHLFDACSKNGPNGYDVDKILADADQPVRAGQRINSTVPFFPSLQPPCRWRSSHLVSAASCGIRRLNSGASRASQPRPVRTVRSWERNTDDANARFPCSLVSSLGSLNDGTPSREASRQPPGHRCLRNSTASMTLEPRGPLFCRAL